MMQTKKSHSRAAHLLVGVLLGLGFLDLNPKHRREELGLNTRCPKIVVGNVNRMNVKNSRFQ